MHRPWLLLSNMHKFFFSQKFSLGKERVFIWTDAAVAFNLLESKAHGSPWGLCLCKYAWDWAARPPFCTHSLGTKVPLKWVQLACE